MAVCPWLLCDVYYSIVLISEESTQNKISIPLSGAIIYCNKLKLPSNPLSRLFSDFLSGYLLADGRIFVINLNC